MRAAAEAIRMDPDRSPTVHDALVASLCEAVESAMRYGLYAEQAALQGDLELHDFYRGLQAVDEDRCERTKRTLLGLLGDESVFTLDAP
jgi:hypothetical protein